MNKKTYEKLPRIKRPKPGQFSKPIQRSGTLPPARTPPLEKNNLQTIVEDQPYRTFDDKQQDLLNAQLSVHRINAKILNRIDERNTKIPRLKSIPEKKIRRYFGDDTDKDLEEKFGKAWVNESKRLQSKETKELLLRDAPSPK